MHDPRPMPIVENLSPDAVLDLEVLGDLELTTYVPIGGIDPDKDEVSIYPNWRGCGASGAVFDDCNSMVPLDKDELKDQGMPVTFDNSLLKSLDQGWVFYSYTLEINGALTKESDRRFFYVGKRPQPIALLPVAQVRGAHNLHIDAASIADTYFTAVVLPYENMTVGDVVTFVWQGYSSTGTARPVKSMPLELEKEQVGQALEFDILKAELSFIKDGKAETSYFITYADNTKPVTSSLVQTYNIKATTEPLLPAIEIPGVVGYLDPSQYTEGVKLSIPNYSSIQAGDHIVIYGRAPREGSANIVIPVDASIVGRGSFYAVLEHQWLVNNIGYDVVLSYQFSRWGAASSSQPLQVTISKERKLTERPHVPRATAGEVGEGEMAANIAVNGIEIKVPDDVELFPTDSMHVRLNEPGEPGYFLGENNPGDQRTFVVPMPAVAPNIGKQIKVYYHVTPVGTSLPLVSPHYTLTVLDLNSDEVAAPICTRPATSGNLSKQAVITAGGAQFTQRQFMYFQEGMWVKLYARVNGIKTYFRGSADQGQQVSNAEFTAGYLIIDIDKEYIQNITINGRLEVGAEISFDGGLVYKLFNVVSLTIVA